MTAVADRRRVFRDLHESGCFVIPNPWDQGSARMLAHLGFRALATTSSGFACSQGRSDGKMSVDDTLAHLRLMAESVDASQRRLRGRLCDRA